MEGMGDLIELPGTGDGQGGVAVLEPEPSRVAKLTVEQREDWIVTLKDTGASFSRIGKVMEVSKQRAHTIYKRAIVKRPGKFSLDPETRRRDMAVGLLMLIETMEYKIHDEEYPSTKDELALYLRTQKALAVLLGLEQPKRTAVTHDDITMTQKNPQAAEFLADLVVWIEREQAINVPGNVRPPLPPGMTERPMIEASTNGHVPIGPHGQGMWSMVLEYPREEDRPRETS